MPSKAQFETSRAPTMRKPLRHIHEHSSKAGLVSKCSSILYAYPGHLPLTLLLPMLELT